MLTPLQLYRRLRDLVLRPRMERDLADEMAFHIEMETAANVRRGMGPADARRLAERQFGSRTAVAEELRDAHGVSWLDDAVRDVRTAVRALRRQPGHAVVAVLTLALGIGATTAVFGVVDGVLLRPLPFDEPGRLVALYERNETGGNSAVSVPNFRDLSAASRSFDAMAAYRGGTTTILGGVAPVRVAGYAVTHDFFRVLRESPAIGRTFAPEESRPGGPSAAIVSWRFWQEQLRGEADLSRLTIGMWGRSFGVIGVMPEGFAWPAGADLWIAQEPLISGEGRDSHNDDVVARLAPGIGPVEAAVELDALVARIEASAPENDALGINVVPLLTDLVGPVRPYLVLLLGAVACVLLVACSNLASAGLARNAARGREIAVRTALGASRGRVVRQMLAESLVLGLVGGACGLLLAWWLVPALLSLAPATLPRTDHVSVDARVATFAAVVSIATGILVGLLPALNAAGVRGALAEGGRGATAGRGRLKRALVAGEVAMAVVLLVGTGLLVRSFVRLLAEHPGFDPRGVLVADVTIPEREFDALPRKIATYDDLLARLRAAPGVEAAGLVNQRPLQGSSMGGGFAIDGREGNGYADYRVVDESYFRAMRIPLLQGRGFGTADDSTAPHVTVISQALARELWPGENPIGRRIRPLGMDAHASEWLTIVGIVGDVRHRALGTEPRGTHYVYYRQRPERATAATIVVRTAGDPAPLARRVRETVRAVSADIPVVTNTMESIVARSVSDRRFTVLVLGIFGALALLLAAVGIYGVLAFSVAQRTREIGIRMALGAAGGSVLRLVARETLVPVVAGLALGTLVAIASTRFVRGMLYGAQGTDPATLAAVTVVLLTAAALASWVPARRAVRVDPIIALRAD